MVVGVIGAVMLGGAAIVAQPPYAMPASFQSRATALRAGEYLWADPGPNTGPLTMVVSLPLQHLYVFRGDRLIGVSTVSTGKPGKRTPVGQFEILQKRVHHRSNLYSNAPMPFMQRLTWTGIALHGGHLPGYPASHGCIRMPMAFARLLFGSTAIGGRVEVVSDDVVAPPTPDERYVPQLVVIPELLRVPGFDTVVFRERRGVGPTAEGGHRRVEDVWERVPSITLLPVAAS